jgi:hypothetical protein
MSLWRRLGALDSKENAMQCHECAVEGVKQEAVALCKLCSAGLCLGHLQEAANYFGAGGTRLACPHTTWSPRAKRLAAANRPGARSKNAVVAAR